MAHVQPSGDQTATLPNGLEVSVVSTLDLDFLYREIFEQRLYLQHGIELQSGDVVLDCGGNIGLFSLFAAEVVGSTGRVLCVEPVESIFEAMQRNIKSHADWCAVRGMPVATITPVTMGIGDGTRESVCFTLYHNFTCWSTMYPQDEEFHQRHIAEYVKQNIEALAGMPPSLYNRAARFFYYFVPRSIFNWSMRRYVRKNLLDAQTEECRMCTVSDLIRSHALDSIDLLKIDVEGAELDVLRGIAPEHWDRIHQVVLEVESMAADSAGTPELDEVRTILGRAGFSSVTVDEPQKGSRVFNVYARRLRDASCRPVVPLCQNA
ncbi:31-O-demethyl-FK506 methyltransferase FkbM [Coccomyxa sp. Obi]|nr:31-O-demethyl-FK506 methyltransferase FkbM [Coccomyxa sp. Obi]